MNTRSAYVIGIVVLVEVSVAAAQHRGTADQERQARRRTPVVEVVEKTRGAVVNISSTRVVVTRSPFGFDSLFDDIFQVPRRATSAGSGFLIHPSGYIVTNAHVVARSTDNRVLLADEPEGKAHPARVVTIDREHDLAVLKIDMTKPLPCLRLGRSDDLMIGETVIAIGNPLGYHHTVTTGVIGAVDRTLRFGKGVTYDGLLQTDAAINPGNSGGPLLNIHGDLIGISTAIRGDAQNIGFAIPVDHLRRLLPEMMTMEIESRRRIQLGMLVGGHDEVRVTSVAEDGSAAKAGIQAGDILREIDGKPVRQIMDFYAVILEKSAGDIVPVIVERDRRHVLTLRLLAVPKPGGAKLAQRLFGLRVRALRANEARALGLQRPLGVLVESVERGGPAAEVGIRRGDVLVQIGRVYGFDDLDSLGRVLKEIRSGDQVRVDWLRAGREYVYLYKGQLKAR